MNRGRKRVNPDSERVRLLDDHAKRWSGARQLDGAMPELMDVEERQLTETIQEAARDRKIRKRVGPRGREACWSDASNPLTMVGRGTLSSRAGSR